VRHFYQLPGEVELFHQHVGFPVSRPTGFFRQNLKNLKISRAVTCFGNAMFAE
jgi:hypothetical protein